MKTPWLIQRCNLTDNGKLMYDYMGSSEFEFGDQAKSLKRIFATGLYQGTTTVNIGDKRATVYMVASKGFPFVGEYQQYLQTDTDSRLHLKEPTGFNDAVKEALGIENDRFRDTNVWFDFENDVLWTLSEENADRLVAVLEDIKTKWSKK
ncbi:hypothetical protein ACFL05_00530 [Patescibacteria group bacterium]